MDVAAEHLAEQALDCIRQPSQEAMEDIAEAAAISPTGCDAVLRVIIDALDADFSDDWVPLVNGLLLLRYLLSAESPRSVICESEFSEGGPDAVRALLGFWAEDEHGNDNGRRVRHLAREVLGLMEDLQLESYASLQAKEAMASSFRPAAANALLSPRGDFASPSPSPGGSCPPSPLTRISASSPFFCGSPSTNPFSQLCASPFATADLSLKVPKRGSEAGPAVDIGAAAAAAVAAVAAEGGLGTGNASHPGPGGFKQPVGPFRQGSFGLPPGMAKLCLPPLAHGCSHSRSSSFARGRFSTENSFNLRTEGSFKLSGGRMLSVEGVSDFMRKLRTLGSENMAAQMEALDNDAFDRALEAQLAGTYAAFEGPLSARGAEATTPHLASASSRLQHRGSGLRPEGC